MNIKNIKVTKSRLKGHVRISGAKNSALKLLTASVLTCETVEILNSPNGLLDMQVHIKMLNSLNSSCATKKVIMSAFSIASL